MVQLWVLAFLVEQDFFDELHDQFHVSRNLVEQDFLVHSLQLGPENFEETKTYMYEMS